MESTQFDGCSGLDADYVEVDCPQFDPLWLRDHLQWFPLAPRLAAEMTAIFDSYELEGTDHD
jgi:hypothetical protein